MYYQSVMTEIQILPNFHLFPIQSIEYVVQGDFVQNCNEIQWPGW